MLNVLCHLLEVGGGVKDKCLQSEPLEDGIENCLPSM